MFKIILQLIYFLYCYDDKIINFLIDKKAIPNNNSLESAITNRDLMNSLNNDLLPGDKFIIPNNTFYFMGGIFLTNLDSIIFQIDGKIIFSDKINKLQIDSDKKVNNAINFKNINNITFRSSKKLGGIINGNGEKWWGIPFLGILIHGENRQNFFILNLLQIL